VIPVAQSVEPDAEFSPRPAITHVVFDFDGTLSWLRHGWPELMAGLFLQRLAQIDSPREGIRDQLLDDILSLNGKSAIFQMERCAERLANLGVPNLHPQEILSEYQEVLAQTIRGRKERIRSGASPDEFLVHGARPLLELLQSRGLVLVILSGTIEHQVKEEAALLGLNPFFGRHVYGSSIDLVASSKQAVIERLMTQERITGSQLLSFGDGPIEIRVTKSAGGLAVGVASDEDNNGSGRMDHHKVALLRHAGADLLIADYRNPEKLVKRLLGS